MLDRLSCTAKTLFEINALTTDSGGGERAVVGVGDEGGTVGERTVGA